MQRSPDSVSPRDMVRSGMCIGCGGCASLEPRAEMRFDRNGLLAPAGPGEWYNRRSVDLATRCPFSPAAADEDALSAERFPAAPVRDQRVGRFAAAYVGHVAEAEYRAQGSSGGLVTWVAAELLRSGAVDAVAHVAPADPDSTGRHFAYRLSRSREEVRQGARSRYYPVELSAVLRAIRETPGRYAIVGVPCFIKAVHLLRRHDPVLRERITHTLGLFCGHMKSARMVDSFAWQLGTELEQVRALDYRLKDPQRPANWYRAHLELRDGSSRSQDWWHLADGDWGAGFFMSPACNWCDDVTAETADIAFGDAWVEPYASDGRGTNVVVVRSPELARMVGEAITAGRLDLSPVDADFVAETQAAGLRHRREGLAYRLTWGKRGIRPRKRVAPSSDLPLRRKLIYRSRAAISRWSHCLMRFARRLGMPELYVRWARPALAAYRGLAWSHGRPGKLFDRLLGPSRIG